MVAKSVCTDSPYRLNSDLVYSLCSDFLLTQFPYKHVNSIEGVFASEGGK